MAAFGKNMFAPLLFLNLALYITVVGFASWCLDRFITRETNPGLGENEATFYFVIFAILAGVVGVASLIAGVNHVHASKSESLGSAASSAVIAWAITALAFGLACKEIDIGGKRGWRLKLLEAFVIVLNFTQLLYVWAIHAGHGGR